MLYTVQQMLDPLSAARPALSQSGPIASKWAPRSILETLVLVDWEPGPTVIVPNWAPHLPKTGPGRQTKFINSCGRRATILTNTSVCAGQVKMEGPTSCSPMFYGVGL